MSISFIIKNKKKFFSYEHVLTVKESLSLIQDLEQFTAKYFDDDNEKQKFYNAKISEFVCLVFGVYGKSGRGFEFSYSKESESYAIRVLTPSIRYDWQLALEFISVLSKKLGAKIISEEGETFTSDSIKNFSYEKDILFGIDSMFEIMKDKGEETNNVSVGIIRSVYFNSEMRKELAEAEDKISAFEKILNRVQYTDAHSARQFFYENNKTGQIFGAYALSQNLRTILPYRPSIDFENWSVVEEKDIAYWEISFCAIFNEGQEDEKYEMIGTLLYDDFIERLSKDKYEFIDGANIVVEPLSYEELLKLLEISIS